MLKIITLDDFSIDSLLRTPTSSGVGDRGYNVLHFNTKNRHYSHNPSATALVEQEIKPQQAQPLNSDTEVLQFAVEQAKIHSKEGILLEFGVGLGRTLTFIAALAYDRRVYGFESGEGIPEWRPGFPEGIFAYTDKSRIPFLPLPNVSLIMGWIEETLPVFKKEILPAEQVALIHIDTDTYEAAHCIYQEIGDWIIPGKTVVVLDEGYNFADKTRPDGHDEWQKYEFRATHEFAARQGYSVRYLAYNQNHQQLVLQFEKDQDTCLPSA